ncbi:MAG: hypothetical protein K940chlam9_00451 [Chlamydiae bacterium]|nr:hypothetical protein [Chlamydiota bacterium]
MIKSSNLTWIVVSDLKKAREFFVKKVGLKELTYAEEFGWVELSGAEGGSRIGLAEKNDIDGLEPGINGVITLTVENLEASCKEFQAKGIKLVGEVMEVPGHVKLQMFQDDDGNYLQLVERLETE